MSPYAKLKSEPFFICFLFPDKLLRNPKPSTSTSLDSYSSNSNSSSDLAEKMARKATLKTSYSVMPAEPKRFKFEPNEDYLDQLIAMGISVNGGKKVC